MASEVTSATSSSIAMNGAEQSTSSLQSSSTLLSSSMGGGGIKKDSDSLADNLNLSWDALSPQMKELLLRRKQLKAYTELTNSKIYDLETSYLEEPNSIGNLLRGWDVDGRTLAVRRGGTDDKDRLFSNSCFNVWQSMKAQQEEAAEKRALALRIEASKNNNKLQASNARKLKRVNSSNANTEDWDYYDY